MIQKQSRYSWTRSQWRLHSIWHATKKHGLDCIRSKNLWSFTTIRVQISRCLDFFLCHASGFLTRNHVSQPYPVFTAANFDQSQPGSGTAAGSMFRTIALAVIKQGEVSPAGELANRTPPFLLCLLLRCKLG